MLWLIFLLKGTCLYIYIFHLKNTINMLQFWRLYIEKTEKWEKTENVLYNKTVADCSLVFCVNIAHNIYKRKKTNIFCANLCHFTLHMFFYSFFDPKTHNFGASFFVIFTQYIGVNIFYINQYIFKYFCFNIDYMLWLLFLQKATCLYTFFFCLKNTVANVAFWHFFKE